MSKETNKEVIIGSLDDLLTNTSGAEVEELKTPEEPVLTKKMQEQIENPDIFQETLREIESVDKYSWSRGTMGLDFGVDWMNKAFRGLNPGLHLFAGSANVGKSSILLQLMWNIVHSNKYQNEDHPRIPYCIYFSLDDTANELMPRLIALDQKITINQALFPKSLEEPTLIQKREAGIQALKDNIEFFTMRDSNKGYSIEYIEETVREYTRILEMAYPEKYQVVIFVDNFHDIQVTDDRYFEDNARFDHVSDKLTEIANTFLIPVLCSAEFRKINVHKRPNIDDIKNTGKLPALVGNY